MASSGLGRGSLLLALCLLLVLLPGRAAAFGAGNIPSIAQVGALPEHCFADALYLPHVATTDHWTIFQVEGVNWRHGGAFLLAPLLLIITDSLTW